MYVSGNKLNFKGINMKNNDLPLMVTIRCITYNHEPYIRQCLEGFVMQKTKFRFEAIVHDDASTDGTATIIREYANKYPDIIKPIYETENQYSKRDGTITRIMNEHTQGKYVAMCEGDDYWIDPYKLQKQVDFLENNPEYGLVCTDVNFFYTKRNEFLYSYFKTKKYPIKYTYEDFLVKGWYLAPCTWLYRKDFLKSISTGFVVGDYLLLLEVSSRSKVKFLNEATAVYRILENSASHFKSFEKSRAFNEGILKIKYHYMERNQNYEMERKVLIQWYIGMIKTSLKYKKIAKSFYYFISLMGMYLYLIPMKK